MQGALSTSLTTYSMFMDMTVEKALSVVTDESETPNAG